MKEVAFDHTYQSIHYGLSEIEHRYGDRVHILSDPFLLSHLAQLCSPETHQPLVNQLVETLYSNLVRVVINHEFPRKKVSIPTRMIKFHKEGVFQGELIDRNQPTISVNLARAGTLPSHICYSALNYILNPSVVRQDHIAANRAVDQKNQVTGTNIMGCKIGGSIQDAIVMIPDPMGATGGTIISALDIYKKQIQGKACKYVALHLIITPEYLRNVLKVHPDVFIYSVRLDRGFSSPDVLKTIPGVFWDQERGLNDKQYIVPGGGGFGEIFNNALI